MVLPNVKQFVVPEVVVSQFHLREGDVVADFGAGSGFFLKPISQLIGESGVLYACDIQKSLVDKLAEVARSQQLTKVRPLWCDLEELRGVPISDGQVDVALLINTLFQIDDKETAVIEMGRTVRPGGRFVVIDWTESFAGLGPQPNMVVSELAARDVFESHGFSFERSFPAGDHHYGVVFTKL